MIPKPLPLEEALAALPEPSSLAARDALAAVCGPLDVQTLTPVLGGASGASIFRVATGSERYLLRVEGAVGPMFRRNPCRFRGEQVAAEAGIAPRVHHVNAAAGVMVTQFIDRRPLASFPGGRVALAGAVGELLRRLQTMSPAIPELIEYPDFVSGMLGHVRASGLFAPGLLDRHVERLSELRARAPWDPNTLVSSHNDVTARNILFDGERLWLIDWEGAYRNGPRVDLSIALDSFASGPEQESALLSAWSGESPPAPERLDAMRAITRLYYACFVFTLSGADPPSSPDADLAAPSAPEFVDLVRAGLVCPGTPRSAHLVGKMLLAAFLNDEPAFGLADVMAAGVFGADTGLDGL